MLQEILDRVPDQHNPLNGIVIWFQRGVPEPKTKNFSTQLGVHLEEGVETLRALDARNDETDKLLVAAMSAMHELGEHLKEHDDVIRIRDRIEFLDGLCDQVVTATGCSHMAGMDIVGAIQQEVNPSNYSKFDSDGQPYFNAHQKIIKGPDYVKPNLERFV